MNLFTIGKTLKKLFASSSSPRVRYGINQTDINEIRVKWKDIKTNVAIGRPSNFKSAILDADKLLDHVLKLYGYRGQTMGDRMKSIPRNKFEREFFDDMWQAHILRNHMVHNMNYEVMSFEAKKAIDQFERVLRELGAL